MPTPAQCLADWPVGREAVLVGTEAEVGGDPTAGAAVTTRLAHLGLRCGSVLTPILHTAGAGVVLASGELRVAVDRATARSILVTDPRHAAPGTPP